MEAIIHEWIFRSYYSMQTVAFSINIIIILIWIRFIRYEYKLLLIAIYTHIIDSIQCTCAVYTLIYGVQNVLANIKCLCSVCNKIMDQNAYKYNINSINLYGGCRRFCGHNYSIEADRFQSGMKTRSVKSQILSSWDTLTYLYNIFI